MNNFLALTIMISLVSVPGDCAEPKKTGIHPPGSAKRNTRTAPLRPPFAHYWDSNSWEKGSGPKFWNKTSHPQKSLPKKESRKLAAK